VNVHIVTCGTSLFGNKDFQARLGVNVDDDPLATLARDLDLASLDATTLEGIGTWWSSQKLTDVRESLSFSWPDDALMSAELTSLSARPYAWRKGDRVVFLASGTVDGVGVAAEQATDSSLPGSSEHQASSAQPRRHRS
jgi:hypothetical protein